MVRQTGCTTILITEIPKWCEQIGIGVEEFVVDTVLTMRKPKLKAD
jgi:hypothetical protein